MPKSKKKAPAPEKPSQIAGSFSLGYYPVRIGYLLGVPHDQLADFLKKKFGLSASPPGQETFGLCFDSGGLQVVWTESLPRSPTGFGHLQHEIAHAIFGAADYVGIERGEGGPGEEFFTYAHGFVTRKIYHAIDRRHP